MKIISSWFTANLLSLNLKKTNYILFGNKKLSDTCIKLNNETISRVYQTKFIGVLTQSNLKWNEHISSIANEISKVIGIINKIKHTLSTDHLKLLYQSLIQPCSGSNSSGNVGCVLHNIRSPSRLYTCSCALLLCD